MSRLNAVTPPTLAPTRVAAQARAQPQATALWHRGQAVSHADLARLTRQWQHHLCGHGLRRGDVLALALPPSPTLLACMLGAWAMGAGVLPLDLAQPPARLALMLEDAGPAVVVAHAAQQGWLRDALAGQAVVVCAEAAPGALPEPLLNGLIETARPQDLAYVLYTSGSTGRPKGVEVSHRALAHKLAHPGAWGVLDASVRGVLLGSIGFDASLTQWLLPLCHGGSVLLPETGQGMDASTLWPALRDAGVTVLDATPSWLAAMLEDAPPARQWQPRRVVLGGEPLSSGLARRVLRHWPDCTLVNAYGPTEACIDASAYTLRADRLDELEGHQVPIGRALPGYRLYVLDAAGGTVPDGEAGELCIAGPCLAEGYRGSATETAARFGPDPWVPGERLYRSGDRVRRDPHGDLHFLGRLDQQVKVRGQRVELGEIEAVFGTVASIEAVAVLALGDPGHEQLVACWVPIGPAEASLDDLRRAASRQLPPAMRPARWLARTGLPLTATGKLDRRALAAELAEEDLFAGPLGAAVDPTPYAPLADAGEERIRQLWAELLELPASAIARHDNFFELGGHSLLAARAVAALRSRHGARFGLAAFMACATLADVAALLDRPASGAPDQRVLRLAHGPRSSDMPPLVCVPPQGGVGTVYAGLARGLADRMPVLALQAVSLPDEVPPPFAMAQLVELWLPALRALQPHGPYRLLGYSAGGAAALALARALHEQGQTVAQLVLLDPFHVEADEIQAPFWDVCRDMLWDAFGLRGTPAEGVLALAQAWWPERHRPQTTAAWAERAIACLPAGCEPDVFFLLLRGVHAMWRAYGGWSPSALQRPPRQAQLLLSREMLDTRAAETRSRWSALSGCTLQAVPVPGSHAQMLVNPASVAEIVAVLRST